MYKIVKEDQSFVRDTTNNSILNVNNEGLAAYKKRKKANMQLKNDVDQLKKDMQDIKSLLVKLIDK